MAFCCHQQKRYCVRSSDCKSQYASWPHGFGKKSSFHEKLSSSMLPHFLLISWVLPLQTCWFLFLLSPLLPSAHGICDWGRWKKQSEEQQEDWVYLSTFLQGSKTTNEHCKIYGVYDICDASEKEERSIYNQNGMAGTATHFSGWQ